MSEEFKRKLQSLSFPRKMGQSEKVPVTDERDGSVGGYHVKHWDGRQDAHITPRTVSAGMSVQGEEKERRLKVVPKEEV